MKKAVSEFLRTHWLNVLESVDEAMIVADSRGSIEFMNEAAAELTGQSASLAIGLEADKAFEPNPWIVELLAGDVAARGHAVHLDGSLASRRDDDIPVHASATPLREEDGTLLGTLLTLQDRRHERELEARTREGERLRELETLVAGLAHEIRNPLSGMRGAAQLLAAQPGADRRVEECTSIVVEEIDRLEGLLSQLLELSGAPRVQHAPVNVHKLLDHVIRIEAANDPEISYVRRYDPSLPPVRGDSDRLTQVLLNLLRNAREVTPAGGAITIETKMETTYRLAGGSGRGRFLSVEVRDQGAGIPQEDLDKIFSPFFTTKSRGTGLGLAISQRIVSEHGGVLRARNSKEQGATFTVTLPVDSGTNHGA